MSAEGEKRHDRWKSKEVSGYFFHSVFDSVINYCTAAAVVINKSQQLPNCKAPSLALIQQPAATYWVIDLQYPPARIHTSLISISSPSKSTHLIKAGGGWMAFFESEKTSDTPEEECGGRVSLLPRQIWIKSTYCRIKVSAINISS